MGVTDTIKFFETSPPVSNSNNLVKYKPLLFNRIAPNLTSKAAHSHEQNKNIHIHMYDTREKLA